uniref:GON domain-containing protein n=1 Tax=Macrostomum lignano TaxID=282301 RepID=A0A1I8HM75_9PLAT
MHWYRVSSCMAVLMLLFLLPCLGPAAGSQLVSFVTVKKCPTADASPLRHRLAKSSEPLVKQLKLKLFYKFSRSGLKNEVNPRMSCLKAYDVTIDAAGAHFKGNTSSYLSTETPGFEKLLDYGKNYSFFLKFADAMEGVNTIYHRYQLCKDETSTPANTFGRSLGGIYNYAAWTVRFDGAGYLRASSSELLDTTDALRKLSIGVVFSAKKQMHFYFNGALSMIDALSGGFS